MSDWTTSSPMCFLCGHTAGYHGATFCAYRAGSGSEMARERCDCKGWTPFVVEITDALLADPAIAADLNDAAQLREENERLRAIEDAARAYRKGVVAATDANLPDNSTELLQWAADEYRLSAALDTALAAYDAARAK